MPNWSSLLGIHKPNLVEGLQPYNQELQMLSQCWAPPQLGWPLVFRSYLESLILPPSWMIFSFPKLPRKPDTTSKLVWKKEEKRYYLISLEQASYKAKLCCIFHPPSQQYWFHDFHLHEKGEKPPHQSPQSLPSSSHPLCESQGSALPKLQWRVEGKKRIFCLKPAWSTILQPYSRNWRPDLLPPFSLKYGPFHYIGRKGPSHIIQCLLAIQSAVCTLHSQSNSPSMNQHNHLPLELHLQSACIAPKTICNTMDNSLAVYNCAPTT